MSEELQGGQSGCSEGAREKQEMRSERQWRQVSRTWKGILGALDFTLRWEPLVVVVGRVSEQRSDMN